MDYLNNKFEEIQVEAQKMSELSMNFEKFVKFIENTKIFFEIPKNKLKMIFDVIKNKDNEINKEDIKSLLKTFYKQLIESCTINDLDEHQKTNIIENYKVVYCELNNQNKISGIKRRELFDLLMNHNFRYKIASILMFDSFNLENFSISKFEKCYQKMERDILYDTKIDLAFDQSLLNLDESNLNEDINPQKRKSEKSIINQSDIVEKTSFLIEIMKNIEKIIKISEIIGSNKAEALCIKDNIKLTLENEILFIKGREEILKSNLLEETENKKLLEKKIKNLYVDLDNRENEKNDFKKELINYRNFFSKEKEEKKKLKKEIEMEKREFANSLEIYINENQHMKEELFLLKKEKKELENFNQKLITTNKKINIDLNRIRDQEETYKKTNIEFLKIKNESEGLKVKIVETEQLIKNKEENYQILLKEKKNLQKNNLNEFSELRERIKILEEINFGLETKLNDNLSNSILGDSSYIKNPNITDLSLTLNDESFINVKKALQIDQNQSIIKNKKKNEILNNEDIIKDEDKILNELNESRQEKNNKKSDSIISNTNKNNINKIMLNLREDFKKTLDEKNQKIEKNKKIIENLKKELDELKEKERNVNSKLKAQNIEFLSQKTEKNNLMKDVEKIIKENEELKTKLDKEINSKKKETSPLILKNDLKNNFNFQIKNLRDKNELLESQKLLLRGTLNKQLEKIKELEEKLNNENKLFSQNSITDQKFELETVSLERDSLKQIVKKLKEKNEKIEKNYAALHQKILDEKNKILELQMLLTNIFDNQDNKEIFNKYKKSYYKKKNEHEKDPKLESLKNIFDDVEDSIEEKEEINKLKTKKQSNNINIFKKNKKLEVSRPSIRTKQINNILVFQNKNTLDIIEDDISSNVKNYSYDHLNILEKKRTLEIIKKYQDLSKKKSWFSDLVYRINSWQNKKKKLLIVTEYYFFIFTSEKKLKKAISLKLIKKIKHNKKSTLLGICFKDQEEVLETLRKEELLLFINRKLKKLGNTLIQDKSEINMKTKIKNEYLDPNVMKKFKPHYLETFSFASQNGVLGYVSIDQKQFFGLGDGEKEVLILLTNYGLVCFTRKSYKIIDFLPLIGTTVKSSKNYKEHLLLVMSDKSRRYLGFESVNLKNNWFEKMKKIIKNAKKGI